MLPPELTRATLFVPGHFFFYPWKPILLYLHSCKYGSAFRNFSVQHDDLANIKLHTVALVVQLIGNFAFLDHLDAMTGLPWSTLSLFGWIGVFLLSGAWLSTKILSSAAAVAAYAFASQLVASPLTTEAVMAACFFLLVFLLRLGVVAANPAPKITGKAITYALLLGLVYSADAFASKTPIAGCLSGSLLHVGIATFLTIAACSQIPGKWWWPRTLFIMVVLRVAGLLTLHPIFLMWGLGFTGQLLQGFSHEMAVQTSTIQKLQGVRLPGARITYECAHVIFFPCLVIDVLQGRRPETNTGLWQEGK